MGTVLAVAGLGLGRAWPEFDPATGNILRKWSEDLLNGVLSVASENDIDALVILGDLFDRTATPPGTVAEVHTLLSALPVPVVVTPGLADWFGPASPYTYTDWEGVEVASGSALKACNGIADWFAAAITRPGGSIASLGAVAPGSVLAVPSYIGPAVDGCFLVTSGERFTCDAQRVVVPPLTKPLGDAVAVLIGTNDARSIVLGPSPIRLHDLDVSQCESTDDLIKLLDATAGSGSAVHLRLYGTVRTGVLLPGFADWSPRPGLTVDLNPLTFAQPDLPNGTAETADVKFLRAMATHNTSPIEQHQAIALGLLALSEDA